MCVSTLCVACRSTFLGSRAIAGTLLKHKQLSAKGPDGLTLEEVLKATGVQRPAEAVAAIALDPKKVGAQIARTVWVWVAHFVCANMPCQL